MSRTTTRAAPSPPTAAAPRPSTTIPVRADDLRAHLVDTLTAGGHLTNPRWRDAFRSVRREVFFPRFRLPSAHGLGEYDVVDPEHGGVALTAAHTDNELTLPPDAPCPEGGRSPAPSLLATMFEHLAAQPGHRVLELGSSGGYHAALLCAALGDEHVTSLEPTPEAAAAARGALSVTGHHPAIVSGPARHGCAAGAPYDRVFATTGPELVPADWVRQLRPGGTLVAPISSGVARLTCRDDGSADGPFVAATGLTPLRDPTETADRHTDIVAATAGTGVSHDAPTIPRGIFTDPAVQFLFRLHHPSLRQVVLDTAAGAEYRLHDPRRGSWARVLPNGRGQVSVTLGGPGDLWRELASLVVTWNEHGRPRVDRYGLTVRPDGTHLLWLDERTHPVAALSG